MSNKRIEHASILFPKTFNIKMFFCIKQDKKTVFRNNYFQFLYIYIFLFPFLPVFTLWAETGSVKINQAISRY